MESDNSPDSIFIETIFEEGSLGVSLKWREIDGVAYVERIVPNTQAVEKNIELGDELWSVGEHDGKNLQKNQWNQLVEYIKNAPRPIKIVWRRKVMHVPDNLNSAVDTNPTLTTKSDRIISSSIKESDNSVNDLKSQPLNQEEENNLQQLREIASK
jgi:C-terminal processing protease CtpA/Prc